MDRLFRACIVGVVFLLFLTAPAGAQIANNSTAANNTSAPPSTTTLGNSTTAANATNASSGGGGFLSGPVIPEIHPGQMVADVFQAGINAFMSAVAGLINQYNWLVGSLPAPGVIDDPSTWYTGVVTVFGDGGSASIDPNANNNLSAGNGTAGNASDGSMQVSSGPLQLTKWWTVTWIIYGALSILVLLPMIGELVAALFGGVGTERQSQEQVMSSLKGIAMVIFGPILIPMVLHAGNAITIGLMPSGSEFLATPGSATKLGVGLVVAVPLLAFEGSVILAGLFVLFVQMVMVFFFVGVWPITAYFSSSSSRFLKPLGYVMFSAIPILILLKIGQAIWLRFLFMLPLDFSASTLLTVFALIAGVLIAFIGLPIKGTQAALPRIVVTAGGAANDQTPTTSETREYAERSREYIREHRPTDGRDLEQSDPPSTDMRDAYQDNGFGLRDASNEDDGRTNDRD